MRRATPVGTRQPLLPPGVGVVVPELERRVLPRWTRLDTDILTQEQTQRCWCAASLGVHDDHDRSSGSHAGIAVGADGFVCTIAWDAALTGGQWRG